jgi:predicted RNA-binding protein (virulence factor B family)
MASIGERNALRAIREAPPGLYLDGEELGEILLPGRYIPPGTAPGDYLEVFLYRDSEDRRRKSRARPWASSQHCG